MKKKIFSAVLVLAMAVGMIACGGGAKSETSAGNVVSDKSEVAEDKASEPVEKTNGIKPCEIKFQYWADNTEYSALMQNIITKFNAENGKGITVVGEELPWDGGGYSNTLFNEAMGGGAPDVATFKLTATPMFTNNKLLTDLTPFVDQWEDRDDIAENIYKIMKSAGGSENTMYVMPWNIQVLYVYYRPSIFQKAGIASTPSSYEELLEDIKKCTMDTDNDGKTDVYGWGLRGSSGGQEPWGSFIYGEGGNFDDLTSEGSVKGMQDFINIYQNGYCPPTALNDGFQETVANFKSGLTAMFIHHTGSSAGMVKDLGDDVDAFAFPAGKGQWTSMGDTDTVMFDACKNKEAAFEWMKYLAVYDGQEMWCEGTGQVPISKRVQAKDFFQNNKFMKASFAGIDYAGIIPIRDTTTEWITNWPSTISQGLIGDKTAKEVMETLNKNLYQ